MQKKHNPTKILPACLGLALAASAHGAGFDLGGIYITSSVNFNNTGDAYSWHDFEQFDNLNLGSFDPDEAGHLELSRVRAITWRNDDFVIDYVGFKYSIKPAGETHEDADFQTIEFPPATDAPFTSLVNGFEYGVGENNYQLWDEDLWQQSRSVDVLDGLGVGNYELQIYLEGSGEDPMFIDPGDFYLDGSDEGDGTGPNYTATFSIVPEPSSAALLGLGGLAFILRRRK